MFGPDRKLEPSENARFFGHGYVILESKDLKTRQASLEICLPHTLLQTITPSLLVAGWVDKLKVKEPITIWLPQLTAERMNSVAPSLHVKANMTLKQLTDEVVQTFQKISQFLVDPSDIVPFLPMGTYVQFRFRCRVDDIPKILDGIEQSQITGVPEFRWALASVLAEICLGFQISNSL